MPIREIDPWRLQYFVDAECPPGVYIPTEDSDAWMWNPAHAWVYDKLRVAQSQGLACGPHGVPPKSFPVFSKPVSNMRGMGIGARIIRSADEYERHFTPGHFWMTLLDGPHVSTDLAVVDGRPLWWRHATGRSAGQGTFDYWTVHATPDEALERKCGAWVSRHLAGYTGMINLETIAGSIIEVHLRLTDQWPDLNGPGWVEAVIRLYSRGVWDFADKSRREGYSVVLFGPHGRHFRHPPETLVDEVRAMPDVSSVQITFHENRDPGRHAQPLGGFRLAIVNAWDLNAGLAARDRLKSGFFS
jgi:hypothetical protein